MSEVAAPGVLGQAEHRCRIIDTALSLGEERGWDGFHIHELAARLDIGLADIALHFAGKDAIAEAWFERADAALLAAPEAPGWQLLSPRERLQRAIFSWLDVLAPHRRLAAEMLRYKLQPEHLHLQIQGVLRVSRTVQWIREAALLPATGWRRECEEAALTAIYLATFACWLRDDSPGASRSRNLLDRLLARAEWVAGWLGGMDRAGPPARRTGPSTGSTGSGADGGG
ncbi:TetR/AcrR family transcriptional regulator [Pseudomonas sp. MAP12]|uniref:TetR/AcrR family transcriptional regulator n=1 Tax=Geopseudomonas aromaticivorans TaxID=2849492 RepID=A0ABS6MUU8_9GAMM|nr:TetR/AcrR family transcriptional regulator [Pseudomonas aromaticivorans]MBV2132116.1 TetR/AcrR family transcriptional regulator [Pseudomonas aromaticivorans]